MRSRLKSVRHIGFNNAKALFCFSSPDIIAFLLSRAAVIDDSELQIDRANAPKLDIERDPMRRRSPLEPITLTAEESNRLAEWTRWHKSSQAQATRARIVLSCQEGRSNGEIAQQ
jgi:hypothetical protein